MNLKHKKLKLAPQPKGKITSLSLYVFVGFNPDYTSGLAFAIASSETDAQAQINKYMGYPITDWGVVHKYPLTKRIAHAVSGGG